jgi:SAM-dependent methyltransferase
MAFALARFHGRYERLVADRKRHLFRDLRGTVLEIGPGTGPNFRHYPPDIRWIGIEPNRFMHPHLLRAAARAGLAVDLREGTAERLDAEDNSVDVVVSTLVLCSVGDLSAVLDEIRRVLRPGGRFLFLEHVADRPQTWTRRIQRMLRAPVRYLADGCHLDRETWLAIERHGFGDVAYQRFRLPVPVVAPHIVGVATK